MKLLKITARKKNVRWRLPVYLASIFGYNGTEIGSEWLFENTMDNYAISHISGSISTSFDRSRTFISVNPEHMSPFWKDARGKDS